MRRTSQVDVRAYVEALADALDVPPSKYREAQDRYGAVGDWLNAEGSPVAEFHPAIYPQGSFALGTATQPIAEDQYDVDAVCRIAASADVMTQQQLKDLIGDRLKAHATYRKMIKPLAGGRRCWTLQYSDDSHFHIDVLPAVPDRYWELVARGVPEHLAKHALQITDKLTWKNGTGWPRSNPRGYAGWFEERTRVAVASGDRMVAMRAGGTVKPVDDDSTKSPLQRLVQMLKRHRDVRYHGDDDKPASIILTTLAASAYRGEANLLDALAQVVPNLRSGIERRVDGEWVPNPVDPRENFADRWMTHPRRRTLFFEWLDAVERDYGNLVGASSTEELEDRAQEAFGERAASGARRIIAQRSGSGGRVAVAGCMIQFADRVAMERFDVPHREAPPWLVVGQYRVTIRGRYKHDGVWRDFESDGAPLPKHCDLIFQATTTAPTPFHVHWQVVNTGDEAESENGLRGSIFSAKELGVGGLKRHERTLYTGSHWAQCFVVHGGKCIARSAEFVVNIR